MIIYEKKFGAFNLLTRLYGSPWPRALILSIPSSLFAACLRGWLDRQLANDTFINPYPYSVFASLLGFILIFRTNLSYQRYWEARTMVTTMSSRWADAAIQAIAFDEVAKEPVVPGGTQFRSEFVHTMSLMHAIAMQNLRGDDNFENLSYESYCSIQAIPPVDPGLVPEWIGMIGFKSFFFLRAQKRHYQKYWTIMTLPVIGGTHSAELELLKDKNSDPVFHIFCWIHRQLVARRSVGGIKQDAPIVSRIYQMLSDGMLGYENAKKIVETPFPFPYAQACAVMLHLNSIGLPLVMAAYVSEAWLAALVTFLGVFSFYLVNEVAREIEEPFKFEPNEIPVANYHYIFNSKLITAFSGSLMPEEGLFPHISDMVIKKQVMEKWYSINDRGRAYESVEDASSHSVWRPKGIRQFQPEDV